MTIGDKIKNYRKLAGLTQKQLAEKCELAEITIRQYESDKRQPRIEQLCKISDALGIISTDLLDDVRPKGTRWTPFLMKALERIGCRLAWDEDDAMIWIEMPNGGLEVTESDLIDLEHSTTSFLRFKLEELKNNHPKDFRPRR